MLFTQEHIIPELKAQERFAAIRELLGQLVQAGQVRAEDQDCLITAFTKREKSMSTGHAFGIASPVASSDTGVDTVMAFGRSHSGIDWDSLDNAPAHFILMFV